MEGPIRILHVLGRLDRGGAETMIMNLYRNIDRSKIQFDFIIHTNDKCDYHDEIYKLGGKIYSVPGYYGKNHFVYKKAWQDFFNNHPKYKIVHGHMRSTASIYLQVAKKHGLITIAHSHSTASRGNIIQRFVKNIIQFPIRFSADYLFACSKEAGEWLFGKSATKKMNYFVIKNAIDLQLYVFNEDVRNEIRTRIGVENESNFVVGHVGSFTFPKNHKFLLRVFKEILKENPSAILLLVGDGELRSEIEKEIEGFGLEDKVILTGTVSNVYEYMHAMDVFVFPSIFEGLGLALIEAQAAGLPCVVSDAIPNEAILSECVTCLSLTNQLHDWAKSILSAKKIDDKNCQNKSIAYQGYDIKDEVKRLVEIYGIIN